MVLPQTSHICGDVAVWSTAEGSEGLAVAIMSRAFIKEPDGEDAVAELPDRQISLHPNLVTADGLAQIEDEIARLQREHAAAQAAGDRVATVRAARELRYWNARRASAQLAPPCEGSTRVHFGSTVTIVRDDGRRQTFRIVGEDEADPARGTLSHVSPVARALFGKEVGDIIRAGQSDAEIVDIS
jgi:transcription elongation GreA/GreB family factor